MIIIKLMIICICAELWYQGGQRGRAWCRDVLIPIILGTCVGFFSVWWIGLLNIGTFNIIRIGYGIPDEGDEGSMLGRTFKKPWLVRMIAGLLYGIWGLLPLFVFSIINAQHLLFYAYSACINSFVNSMGEVIRLNIKIIDRLAGAAISSFILFL